jgi:hypothetical protein
MIDSVSSWIIAFDNISELPGWLSDAVCRLSAGGGYATRTLYTDRDQELFEAMRPVVLNGITDVATSPDLLNRALIINLRPIERASRREEREVFTELEAARPKIMGFLFDAISEGLRALPNVKVEGLPRMADFARWSVATEQALGGSAGAFMEAYGASQVEAVGQRSKHRLSQRLSGMSLVSIRALGMRGQDRQPTFSKSSPSASTTMSSGRRGGPGLRMPSAGNSSGLQRPCATSGSTLRCCRGLAQRVAGDGGCSIRHLRG